MLFACSLDMNDDLAIGYATFLMLAMLILKKAIRNHKSESGRFDFIKKKCAAKVI